MRKKAKYVEKNEIMVENSCNVSGKKGIIFVQVEVRKSGKVIFLVRPPGGARVRTLSFAHSRRQPDDGSSEAGETVNDLLFMQM